MRTSHRALLQKSGNKYIIEMDAEVIEAVGWLEGSEGLRSFGPHRLPVAIQA